MGVCKKCGKRGLFLSVDSRGLCSDCIRKEESIKRKSQERINNAIERTKKARDEGDREIKLLNDARAKLDAGGDLDECIKVYSEILSRNTRWNKFNFWLSLIALYQKAGNYDKAWESIQRANAFSMSYGFPVETMLFHDMKLEHEAYKISKHEKRYYDALRSLIEYHVLKSGMQIGNSFNYEAFWKEGQSLFKMMKLTSDQIDDLTNQVCCVELSLNVANDAGDLVKPWMEKHKLGIFSNS